MKRLYICLILGVLVMLVTGCGKEYYCDEGDTLVGDTCLHKETTKAQLSCGSSMYVVYGGKCVKSQNLNFVVGDPQYRCSEEDATLVGDTCLIERTYDAYTNKEDIKKQIDYSEMEDDQYQSLSNITYEQYKKLYDSKAPFVLLISQTECSYCDIFKPILDDYIDKNNLSAYVLELDQLSDEDRSKLLSSLSYFETKESWGTPLTLKIKNKEVISELVGFNDDESKLEELFTK